MHRLDQLHLTIRLKDCLDRSHLDVQSNTAVRIRKGE
jgi:hypothetical protein